VVEQEIIDAFDLSGRVAVLTGAGGGIGRQAALTFAGAGAAVVISDLPGKQLEETEAMLRAKGATVLALAGDVRGKRDVDELADAALDVHGRIDVWANVAAILRRGPMLETPAEELDDVIAVNLKGTYFGCQAAGRAMVSAGRGSIINLASQGMDFPTAGISVYALTKAAVAMITRTVATELGPHGVRANSVAPGFISTPMTAYRWTNSDGSVDEDQRRAALDQLAALTPLRTTGEPIDIALTMLFLASDASRYITGQVLRPNGGGSMV
jgi:3-oxoacyl-[acyl-carrier protein] reductase